MRTKVVHIINDAVKIIEGNLFKDIEEILYDAPTHVLRIKLDSLTNDYEDSFLLDDFDDLMYDVTITRDTNQYCTYIYIEV